MGTIVELYLGPHWRDIPLGMQPDLRRAMDEFGANIYRTEGIYCDWYVCDLSNEASVRFAERINALRGYSAKLTKSSDWRPPVQELRQP